MTTAIPNKVLSLGVMSNNYSYAANNDEQEYSSQYVPPSKSVIGANSSSHQDKMLAQARYRAKLESDQGKEPIESRKAFTRREAEEVDIGLSIGKDVSKEQERRDKIAAQEKYRSMIAEAQSRPAVSGDRRAVQRPVREDDENSWSIGRAQDKNDAASRQREHNARVQGDMADKQERLRRLAAAEKETFSGLLIGRQDDADRKKKKSHASASSENNIFSADSPSKYAERDSNRARMREMEAAVSPSGLVMQHAKAPKKVMPPFVYAAEERRPGQQNGSARREAYDNNKPFEIGSENNPSNSAEARKNRQSEYRLALSRDIEEKDDVRVRNEYLITRKEL